MDLTDEDQRDPYINAETGESLRTLVAEYAEQANSPTKSSARLSTGTNGELPKPSFTARFQK